MTDVTLAPVRATPGRLRRETVGLAIVGLVAVFAVLGPLFVGDPARQSLSNALSPMLGEHVLGTDHYGRDLLARLAHGARLSFGFGLLTTVAAALPGVLLGVVAAWSGGIVDRVLTALSDVVLALPGLLLVLILVAFAPGDHLPLFLGISLYLWVEFFRVSRAAARAVLVQPYVEAARLLGFGRLYVFRRFVVPALTPLISTLCAFGISTAVVAIATLSAISVGLRPPTPELGSMMVEMMPYYAEAPLHVLAPAILVFLLVLGLQLASGREPR